MFQPTDLIQNPSLVQILLENVSQMLNHSTIAAHTAIAISVKDLCNKSCFQNPSALEPPYCKYTSLYCMLLCIHACLICTTINNVVAAGLQETHLTSRRKKEATKRGISALQSR